ncbi:MAG: hypothetical protein LC750_16770 [Actinobacteria bacterium]|nr:hypothetical protein [Actinomycetota bacterium]
MSRIFINGRQLERIAPGIYDDGAGGMHLVVDELLRANGYADTPANREMVIAVARELLAHNNPPVTLKVFE